MLRRWWLTPSCLTKLPILCHRHWVFINPVPIETHSMLWALIEVTVVFFAAHQKVACRDKYHLGAVFRVDRNLPRGIGLCDFRCFELFEVCKHLDTSLV